MIQTLKSPVMITSRLLPGVKVGNATISLERAGRLDSRGAEVFRWFVDLDNREFSDDEFSGRQGIQGMLASLLCFLSAFAESWRYAGAKGENASLFPVELAEWAMQNADELGMLQLELEETPGLIEEE